MGLKSALRDHRLVLFAAHKYWLEFNNSGPARIWTLISGTKSVYATIVLRSIYNSVAYLIIIITNHWDTYRYRDFGNPKAGPEIFCSDKPGFRASQLLLLWSKVNFGGTKNIEKIIKPDLGHKRLESSDLDTIQRNPMCYNPSSQVRVLASFHSNQRLLSTTQLGTWKCISRRVLFSPMINSSATQAQVTLRSSKFSSKLFKLL